MNKILPIIFLIVVFFNLASPAFAQFQRWEDSGCVTPEGVATLACLPIVFKNVIAGFLIFVGAVALVMIVFSGYKLITSGGDPKKVEAARQIMTYAIIGAILVLSSFAILYFIGYVTGSTECITDTKAITSGGCK